VLRADVAHQVLSAVDGILVDLGIRPAPAPDATDPAFDAVAEPADETIPAAA
jgi:hypothetical protein